MTEYGFGQPYGFEDDHLGWLCESPRERAKSLDGRALLRNFGPRPLETEEDRVAKSREEMARLIKEAQQKAFMDRLMREVDAGERAADEPHAQAVEMGMDLGQVFTTPQPTLNGTWRYRDIEALGPPGRGRDNGGVDL